MIIRPLVIIALWEIAGQPGAMPGEVVTLNQEEIPHRVWHETALPGETVSVSLPDGMSVYLDGEHVTASDTFSAPDEPGTYDLDIRDRKDRTVYDLAFFVLEPASRIGADGRLEGYRIGDYPQNDPRGYIRLEEGYGDVKISPSFRIGQFLCKQQPGHWPKYLQISSPNLKRLEILLESLREDGLTDAETYFVMSGYRTPFYNTAIGSARLSRHMYGDATDVYVDVAPKDGVMDDINQDGVVNKRDANFLYDYAQELFSSEDGAPRGGLGSYSANAVHGPFVHVDGRGRPARWGR